MPAEVGIPSLSVLSCVSLEQFAGVGAALADGLPLEEVLDEERIDPTNWPTAGRAWREAIAESPDLQIECMQKRRVAEDCLGREVDPLDSDPSAWLGLLGALATRDSTAVLSRLGLTMVDVARLGRRWRRKTQADASLAKRFEEVAPDANAPEEVKLGPVVLRPFPWTPVSDDGVPGPADADPPEHVPGSSRAPPKRQLASFQLSEQAPSAPGSPGLLAGPVARAEAVQDLDATMPPILPASATLPFQKGAPSAAPIAAHGVADQSGETVAIRALEFTAPLPFERDAAGFDIALVVAPDPDETAMMPSPFAAGTVLPFQGATTDERLAELVAESRVPGHSVQGASRSFFEGTRDFAFYRPSVESRAAERAPSTTEPSSFNPDETLPIPAPPVRSSTGTFRDQLGPVTVPILSLAEYVDLRVALALHGENDVDTLQRYGIMSRASSSALKARFAEYFKRDPEAQLQFLDAVAERVSQVRGTKKP